MMTVRDVEFHGGFQKERFGCYPTCHKLNRLHLLLLLFIIVKYCYDTYHLG